MSGQGFRTFAWFILSIAIGCTSPGPQLAPADGVLTIGGKPFAKAIVTFLPLKGPPAMAVTDANGKFQLVSGTQRGVVVGPVTVTVVVSPPTGEDQLKNSPELARPPKTPEEAKAYHKKANELQAALNAKKRANANKPNSQTAGVPKPDFDPRFGKAETSGLSFTIKANGDNHFKIHL